MVYIVLMIYMYIIFYIYFPESNGTEFYLDDKNFNPQRVYIYIYNIPTFPTQNFDFKNSKEDLILKCVRYLKF